MLATIQKKTFKLFIKMYRGFNLQISEPIIGDNYLSKGKAISANLELALEERIEDLIQCNNIIDGNEVIEKWFPEIECDIFLSHSHKDKDKALSLAGYLESNFGLKTFIDSTVWGFSDRLLKEIDNHFCLNENGKNYNYDLRNYSTSHVHLMLKSALDKMIDNCEAIFFLNTPNSITPSNSIKQKTKSPWIFSEIATTQIIRKKTPQRLRKETRLFSTKDVIAMTESAKSQLNIQYELELNHFTKLTIQDIQYWKNCFAYSGKNALDVLYSNNPIDKKFLV